MKSKKKLSIICNYLEMSKLKRLQYGYFLIKGINLKEVMIENRFIEDISTI